MAKVKIALPKVVGGIGEMKSNNNTQYYMQDRVYEGEVATTIPANESFQPYFVVDDTYKNRDERVYEDSSPSLRAGRSGLKVASSNKLFKVKDKGFSNMYAVYDQEKTSPCLNTMSGGGKATYGY